MKNNFLKLVPGVARSELSEAMVRQKMKRLILAQILTTKINVKIQQ
ncbi:hypothetical protein SAMN05880574_1228 [Chryseobacterium sp. RU37D]|nr:hypothetical protein SAMN05880574_1228 [Chryseobacterium sp. RU37D]